MKQRLGIAAALLRRPKLLLLDEPATGLDPAGMRDMRRLVRRLADDGMTVLLSSHLLAEVEELCNRVAIVRSGSVVYEGELDALRAEAGTRVHLRSTDDALALRVCEAQPGIEVIDPEITLKADDDAALAALSVALVGAGAGIIELAVQHATLEDLFFRLTEGDAAPAPA